MEKKETIYSVLTQIVNWVRNQFAKKTDVKIYVGTCSTAAATAAKVVMVEAFPTITVNNNTKPVVGTMIAVKFSATNTAENATLDVNGLGGASIYYNNYVYRSGGARAGAKDRYTFFVWDGTYWVWQSQGSDDNTTYSNEWLGNGIAVQKNASQASAVTATLSSYVLVANGRVSVVFTHDVPAGATLNVNYKGAKAIYYYKEGILSPIEANMIKAHDVATFVYNGTYYVYVSKWFSGSYNDLKDKPTNVSEFTNDSGYLTGETDPTVPSWAKQPTKPSYASNEITDSNVGGTIDQTMSSMQTNINNKVDKETGKGLSTNDYTTTEKTKLAGIEAGAEKNVQGDWAQNDTTADDYIKNRTHYVENVSTSDVWYQTNVEVGSASSSPGAYSGTFNLTEGKTYNVTISQGSNTKTYEGIVCENNTTVSGLFLNKNWSNPMQGAETTSDAFYILVQASSVILASADVYGSGCTVQVSEVTETIHKLDPKYLPDNVTNAPDEEDLTSENQGGTDVLKFKDKAYNSALYSGLGRVYLRKNIVTLEGTGKNVLTQAMVNTANTVYHIQYDYDLNGAEITIPEGCVLEFDGGSLRNGTIILQNTLFDGIVKFDTNVEFSGTCSNEEIKQDWFVNGDINAFFSFINNVTTNRDTLIYLFKAGTYYPTIRVNKISDKNIVLRGNGATLIYNSDIIVEGQYMISFVCKQSDTTKHYLTEEATPSSGHISLDSITDLNVGDMITIRDSTNSSFSHYRDYQQGEIFKVREVLENTQDAIVPDNFLFGNYTHISNSKSYVIKTDFRNLSVEGLTLKMSEKKEATFDSRGICFTHYRTNIQNIDIQDFRYCITLEYCIDGNVSNCVIIANSNTASNFDNYGLLIINSQNIVVNGGKYYGGNHGIAVGGHYSGDYSIINRFITICNTECYSYKFRIGIDAHGNTEYCKYINNVSDGIHCGANHSIVSGNVVTGYINQGEPCGLDIQIINNICTDITYVYSDSTSYPNATLDNEPKHGGEILVIRGNNVGRDLVVSLNTKERENNTHISTAQVLVSDNNINGVCRGEMLLKNINDEVVQDADYSFVVKNNNLNDNTNHLSQSATVSFIGNRGGTAFYVSCKKLELFDNVSKKGADSYFMRIKNTNYTFSEGYVYNNKALSHFLLLNDVENTAFNLYCKNNIALNGARFLGLNPKTWNEALYNIYFDNNDIIDGRFSNNVNVPINEIISRKYLSYTPWSCSNIAKELGTIVYKNMESNNNNVYTNTIGDKIPLADIEGTKLANNNDTFKIPYLVTKNNYLCGLLAVKQGSENVLLFIYNIGASAIATHVAGSLFDFGDILFGRNTTDGYYYIKFSDTTKITDANFISINTTTKKDEFCTSCVSSDLSDINFSNIKIKNVDGTPVGVKRTGLYDERPLADIYEGYEFYATDLKETLTYIEDTKTGDNIGGTKGGSVYTMANNLISGKLYDIKTTRSYTKCYFSKVSENPTEEDLLLAVHGDIWTTVIAPDPSVYPYIYIDNTGGDSYSTIFIRECRRWLQYDGAVAGVLRSGTFDEKPIALDIYVGFKYFCTDKQTTEGGSNGIEIIHKGNDVWVDALGRVVN